MKNKPHGYVVFYEDARGEWRWAYRAPNGKIMADCGEGYASKRNAIRAWRKFGEYLFFFLPSIKEIYNENTTS